jgi:hypothetical protein
LLGGCAAAVIGVGAGVLISQEMLDNNSYVAQLNVDSERAWSTTKTSISHASLKPVDVDNEERRIQAEVDGAQVTVAVETYDLDKSIVRVTAKKYGVNNGEIAKMVLDRIVLDLEG